MSRIQRHIKSQSNTINEVSYAIIKRPTTATFISEKTMETNAETESIRQANKVVYIESTLVKNKKAKGQKKTKSIKKNLESETVGVAQPYVSLIKI
mgnify:FL=1